MKTSITAVLSFAALLGLAVSSAFAANLTEKQQAAIRQEVTQAMKGFTTAAEHLDLEGALQFRADVPEFSYADTDGKLYDYPAARKIMVEVFADSTALKILPQRQEISVLGPDAALVAWNGAAEFTQKDGTVLRVDPYNITFLFKRLGGSWKIVRQHESALPPQPVKPASLPAPAPADTTTTVLRMLDDYFAAVNARDPAKFLDFFVGTEDLTVFEDNDLRSSRKDFVAFVDGFFKDLSQIQATWERRTVNELAPNVVVVTGTFKVDAKDTKGASMAFRNAFTYVLVKQGERWLMKHVHESSLPKESPPAAATPATARPAVEIKAPAAPAPAAAGTGMAPSPAQPERKIRLTDAPLDRRLLYTAWRTDYYICTGIAYAKSLGHSVEDFAAFVGSQHEMGTTSADGLTKIAKLLDFGLTNYPKGQVIVTAESDTAITMQFNRAYRAYFEKGPVLSVTMDEFERCFWGHLEILAKRKGFGFAYRIEGENVTFTISLGK